ncbi:Inactive phospholipase C-like protein 2 [Holothuria leucospilota]|uniref:Inactive phospholipase C-like protein 2 n=1 Tax=Holothuria leucospilota TaxID=206669 RepID=A0A9Q1HKL9_HOLLE|nr:Inactive phospholipase C-like protein 2 [Holothuria leucospilota]
MEIFGIPADCAEERTKTVPHNGHHPIFDESFEFTVNLPEQALVRFVVLDDEYIGDEFIGQYTIPFECLQPGYRHFTLLSNTGESLAPASLFIHVAITNKRGGGKPSKRGMSVKRMRNSKKGVKLRTVGVKAIDENFKNAITPFRESFELRDKVQSAVRAFKESCGLASIANLKQCIRVLSSRAVAATEPVQLKLRWNEQIVILEMEGGPPEILRKSMTAFELFADECTVLLDRYDGLHDAIEGVHRGAMELYESLSALLQKEGLKGKKLAKSTEGFAWNIRVLKGQMDILSHARKEIIDWMTQVYDAGTALGLTEEAASRASQETPQDYSDNEDSEGSREQDADVTLTRTKENGALTTHSKSNHVGRTMSDVSSVTSDISDISRKTSASNDTDDAVFLETVLEGDGGTMQTNSTVETISEEDCGRKDEEKTKVNNNLDSVDTELLEARLAAADFSTDI